MTIDYFSSLNYSMANEDNRLEYKLCEIYLPQNIVSVCGSGGRTIPLLAHQPKRLVCLDLVEQQLFLAKLRYEVNKNLTHDQFMLFWGYPPYGVNGNEQERKGLFESLKLEDDCKKYFESLFERLHWRGLIYDGNWENTFVFLSKIVKGFLPKSYRGIFDTKTLDEQNEYYQKVFPRLRWNFLLFFLGNKSLFNALLYKGDFVKKNVPESHWFYYKKNFHNLFTKQLVRESFFVQLCFLGEILYPEGVPLEAEVGTFEKVKANVNTEMIFLKKDLISAIIDEEEQVDFVSMSNVPSYFSGDIEKNFMQTIRHKIKDGGIVIYRCHLRIPEANLEGYEDISSEHQDLIEQEKVQMFRIRIFKKIC
jgi:S-adenosylmethionine-diacylglycerol 3-amino-3-carboxypropyl transferase